jgi:hypothetical protein
MMKVHEFQAFFDGIRAGENLRVTEEGPCRHRGEKNQRDIVLLPMIYYGPGDGNDPFQGDTGVSCRAY